MTRRALSESWLWILVFSIATGSAGLAQLDPKAGSDRGIFCGYEMDDTTTKVVSEIVENPPIDAEVAAICGLGEGEQLTHITWWGGPVGQEPENPVTAFNVRFYTNLDCTPDSLITEFPAWPLITPMGVGPDSLPIYRYDLNLTLPLPPGLFWAVIQGHIVTSPPEDGSKGGPTGPPGRAGCVSMFRSAYHDHPDWTPIPDMLGWPWVAASEFGIGSAPTPIVPLTWGRVKSIYR